MNLTAHANQQRKAARQGRAIETLPTCRIALLSPEDLLANCNLAEGCPSDASSIIVDERSARRAD